MKIRFLPVLLLSLCAAAQSKPPSRPPITGISHIAVYTTDAATAEHFYRDIIGCAKGPDPENLAGKRYYINSTQFVEVLALSDTNSPNRLDHLAYKTANAENLRLYLKSRGVEVPSKVRRGAEGEFWFDVKDPEGNMVQFVESAGLMVLTPDLENDKSPMVVTHPQLVGNHIIHVGMVVHSREKEDAFYREILGFKPYWFGGMQPGKISWVSQQTPESHDWLEYMMTGDQPLSQHQLGVQNHFSIGVVSMEKTYATLQAAGRIVPPTEKKVIGKDGKWQLNVYDPDGTRVEYMEFSNVQQPCCSEFTAPNPSPSE